MLDHLAFAALVLSAALAARTVVRNRSAIKAYLRQPLVLTRRAFLGLALAAGLAVGIGVVAVLGLADERSQRSAQGRAALKRELARERAARRASDAFNRRLARQESPSDHELAVRVRRFLRLLARHPALRQRLRSVGLGAELNARIAPGPPTPARSTPGSAPTARRPPPRRRRPAAPGPTPSQPAPTTTTPVAPPPRPPVDIPAPTVTTPAGTLTVPSFCARPVGGIGC